MKAWADETRRFLEGIGDPMALAFKASKWDALPEAVFGVGGAGGATGPTGRTGPT